MLILLWNEFSGYEELKSNLRFLSYQDNYGLLLRKQNNALWYHFQMTDTSIKLIHNVKIIAADPDPQHFVDSGSRYLNFMDPDPV